MLIHATQAKRVTCAGMWIKPTVKTQRRFKCVSCGHADHADRNASANILASGIGTAGRGGAFSIETPVIRQIDGMFNDAV